MQVFLPYANIYPSVACLSNDMLYQARIDARHILDTLENKSITHRHHPAVKMFKGYEELLKGYLAGCIKQWVKRGYRSRMESPKVSFAKVTIPLWWGGPIHKSHKAQLLRTNNKHYGRLEWDVDCSTPVFWPVKHNGQLR
jgi:hypothetical protein